MKTEGVRKAWDKYKYIALIVLVGVVLLLWPSGTSGTNGKSSSVAQAAPIQKDEVEREMETILSKISGVGKLELMLTVDTDGERRLARDQEASYSGSGQSPEDWSRTTETVLIGSGSSEAPIVVETSYPTYRGALVVCEGGDQADVKLAVTQAVSALTGLSSDRITVARWQ